MTQPPNPHEGDDAVQPDAEPQPEPQPDWQQQAAAAGWTPPASAEPPATQGYQAQGYPPQGYQPQEPQSQGYPPPYPYPQQQPYYGHPYYQQPYYQQPYYQQPYDSGQYAPQPGYYQQPAYAPEGYPQGYPQQTSYGPPQQPRPAHPHAEPRNFALVMRNWDYHWWKPLVGVLVFSAGALVVMPLLLMPLLLIGIALEGPSATYAERLEEAATLQSITPSGLLYLNLVLAALIPLSMFLMRFLHGMRPRWLTSVMPGMRWRFLAVCFGLSVVCMMAASLVGLLLPVTAAEMTGSAAFPTGELLVIAIVVLLTTPLQAIGEEYAFRGYLLQAFGAWARNPWLAVAITALLFALAHGTQNFPLFFDRLAFGVIAGVTVVLVGGLEPGIAMHVVNNLVAFGFAIAFDELVSSLTVSEVSYWQIPVTLVQHGTYLVLVLWVARRMKVQRLSSPPTAATAEPAPQPA